MKTEETAKIFLRIHKKSIDQVADIINQLLFQGVSSV